MKGLSEHAAQFEAANAQVLGVSVDSRFCHKAFAEKEGLKVTLLSDFKKEVARQYGALLEDRGIAGRHAFVIDTNGIVREKVVSDLPNGRDIKQLLEKVKAVN